jgi:hypothetical protein
MSDKQSTLDEIIERRDILLGLKQTIAVRVSFISGEEQYILATSVRFWNASLFR